MRATPVIALQVEGTIEDLLLGAMLNVPPPPPPTVAEVSEVLGKLCFMVETVAHLQGKERAMLPTAEEGRKLIERLKPVTLQA